MRAVSDTPEKIEGMRNSIILIAFSAIFFFNACKSSQKTATSVQATTSVQELPDDKKKEFEFC